MYSNRQAEEQRFWASSLTFGDIHGLIAKAEHSRQVLHDMLEDLELQERDLGGTETGLEQEQEQEQNRNRNRNAAKSTGFSIRCSCFAPRLTDAYAVVAWTMTRAASP